MIHLSTNVLPADFGLQKEQARSPSCTKGAAAMSSTETKSPVAEAKPQPRVDWKKDRALLRRVYSAALKVIELAPPNLNNIQDIPSKGIILANTSRNTAKTAAAVAKATATRMAFNYVSHPPGPRSFHLLVFKLLYRFHCSLL